MSGQRHYLQLAGDRHRLIFGVLLIVGLLIRLAALYGLGFALSLALIYASSNRWVFEQSHEYVPFIILALIPTGRMCGLHGAALRRRGCVTTTGGLRRDYLRIPTTPLVPDDQWAMLEPLLPPLQRRMGRPVPHHRPA